MEEERRPLEQAARDKEEVLDVASEVRRSGLQQLVGFFGCGSKSVSRTRDERSVLDSGSGLGLYKLAVC